ncbi:cirrhosis, autosomal recessive 1A (cirhin) [Perkinsus olseni]|uniref:Cirrhosis, autosomal recessive 1A (Cirhin) n=1 Tax=Perkinsus olseni TaxID=32597 RepID=A0A7J6NZK8_PEROL|nr:cirrhosis, autosomal recessive 1A (cirhin) [Perkinsus olseni]
MGNTTCVSDSMRILPHTNAGGGVLVWSLKALSKDRIVSGDSSGCLTLWDVDKHVQLQRIREHQADILCMTVRRSSENHDLAIFTTGVDAKISKFAEASNGELTVKTSYFVNRRDVNAISLHPQREILVCGGNDGQLVITSTKAQFTPTKLPHFHGLASSPSGGGVVRCSSSRRLVLTVWRNSMKIWYIPDKSAVASIAGSGSSESLDMLANGGVGVDTPTRTNKPICLQEVALSAPDHIVASDMSKNGEIIACCTASGGVRIFSFVLDELELSRLAVVPDLKNVTALCLDDNSQGSSICYAADSDSGRIQRLDASAPTGEHAPWGSPFRGVVTRMALSPVAKNGSRCLVVADSYGDVHCMGISESGSEAAFSRTCCLPSHRRNKKAKRRLGAIENRNTGKIFATSISFSKDGNLCFITSSSSMLYCFKIGPKAFDLLWHVDVRANISQGSRQHTKGVAVAESRVEIPGQIFHTVQVTSVEARTKQGSPTSVKVVLFADSLILAGDIKCDKSPVEAAFTVVKSRFSDDTESKRWMGSHVLGCAQLDEQDWLHGYTDTIPNGIDGEEEGASPKKRRRRASSAGGMPGGVVAAAAQDRSLVLCSVIDQTDIDQQLPPAFDRKHFYR